MADTDLTDIEANLRQMGAEADASSPSEDSTQEITLPASEDTPTETSAEEDQRPDAEKTESSGTEAAKPAAPVTETKKELSPYEQAKSDKKDREAKAWQKIEAEKAALKAEREKIEAARTASEPKANEPARDRAGYSSADYLAAAKQFEEAGDDALAQAARKQAQTLGAQDGQQHQKAILADFVQGVKDVTEKRKEFADHTSPEGEAIKAIIREFPHFSHGRKGFASAVAVYDSRRNAASVPELQKQVEALTKEKERLTKLTSLPGSTPHSAKSKSTTDPTERDLRRMAEEHDAA